MFLYTPPPKKKKEKIIIIISVDRITMDSVEVVFNSDENRIFPIEAILKHKQVVCMRSKVPFTVRKDHFFFQRYSSF